MRTLFPVILLLLSSTIFSAEIKLQVLGSGGPIADDARASSGYIVSIAGRERILIDAGAGVFQRIGEAGINMDELSFIGFSHFHTDHSADFPALLKSAYFGNKTSPLTIAGPAGSAPFPGLNDWLSALFAPGKGAYAYLSAYIDGSADPFALNAVEIPLTKSVITRAATVDEYTVSAISVPHGPVPALAYSIQTADFKIVISGDQNLSDPAFLEFVKNADLWLMPFPIPEDAGRVARNLHATPSRIGEIANTAGVKTLLLSHFMARSLVNLEQNVALVKKHFNGPVLLAEDLAQWSIDTDVPQQGWQKN